MIRPHAHNPIVKKSAPSSPDSELPPTERQLNVRSQLFRIQTIHNIVQANRYPNGTTLAKVLEVSTRTIRRDIEFMTDSLELPLEYNPSLRGYHYTSYVDCLPTQSFTSKEVRALEVAITKIEDSNLFVTLNTLLEKICQLRGA